MHVLSPSFWSDTPCLNSDRLLPPAPLPSPESLLAANPYTPPLTLIQRIISSDPELAEWQILHSHLMRPEKGRSTPFGLVERKEGYWALTAGFVRRGKMVGGQSEYYFFLVPWELRSGAKRTKNEGGSRRPHASSVLARRA